MKKQYRNLAIYTVAFIAILLIVKTGLLSSLDTSLQHSTYNGLHSKVVTDILDFLTNYTLGTVLGVAAVALLLVYKKHFYGIISLGASFVGLYVAEEVLKKLIERSRPFIADPTISYLGHKLPDGFGFPSGHTTIAFFLCIVVIYKFREHKWIKYAAYLLTFLVAFSRLYLGAHYPLDVFGGATLGLFFGHVAIILDKKLPQYFKLPDFLANH